MSKIQQEPVRRLPRAERREQILAAATNAFARTGFAGTGLDGVAAEAGISRVILYRHFESKTDLYRAVLERAMARLAAATDVEVGRESAHALLRWADAEPAGFRLLFRHAAREPEFCAEVDELRAAMTEEVRARLAGAIAAGPWADWAAQLATAVCLEAIMAWLDAGRPEPNEIADRIDRAVEGVIQAAGSP
ncbi:TetR/AcrR family transcriptional regulator [Saccharopolyspora sp. 5N102]|uniref:TetR/AcrR family transcriptional regulator n=1 Tax=Saccharopolyspora sp. 5N102 TaxID=3375155 RepID=UPI0037BC6DF5